MLDRHKIRWKLRSIVDKRWKMAVEGILTLGVLSEQSSPGHRLESAQNLVWNVVLRVLVRMWGWPKGPVTASI